jgi:hypothetical protein
MELAPFLRNSQARRALPESPSLSRKPGQFSIGTVLVVTAMFAVALAGFQSSLGMGIGLMLLVLGAILRTAIVEGLRARDRSLETSTSVISEVFMSVPLLMLAAAAGSVVFWLGCLVAFALVMQGPGPAPPNIPLWPIGVGCVLGIVAAGFVLWLTRNAAKRI